MTTVVSKLTDIQARLDALARQHKVPGASLGVMSGDEVLEFTTGVANKNTGVPVTSDTLFQIGSNTKLYTTTLVMQLVDEGKVDLDSPVKRYVPELKLADAKGAETVTVRQLLTHTSGIEGDYFDDFGRGDDGIERYVASLENIGSVYAPAEMWSYCNSGFVLAGRLVEKITGDPYHKVLRERILAPLGLPRTTVLMEEMLAHSCAVGHIIPPEGNEPVVPPRVMMSPSQAPAGSMTVSTPREVIGFVRMHLDGGTARDGKRVLSADAVKAMQQPQAKLPRSSLGEAMGLGWLLSSWGGERVIGHGGGTIGQLSFLQCLPDRRIAVVLLTNSMTGGFLWRDLGRWLFDEVAGVKMPVLPKPPAEPPDVDLKRYVGTYRRHGVDIELAVKDGSLAGKITYTGALSDISPAQEVSVRAIDDELFEAKLRAGEAIMHFMEFDGRGRPRWLHMGGRVSRRVAGERSTGAKARAKRPAAKGRTGAKKRAAASRKGRTGRRR